MVSVPARRLQVAYATRRGLSVRRACRLLGVARSSLKYVSRLEERDRPVVEAMKRLASQYPRYGYRRIQVFLEREGYPAVALEECAPRGAAARFPASAPAPISRT